MSNRLIVICLVLLGLYFANAQQQDNAMPVQQAQQISREANKSPITVAPGAAKPGKGILGKIKINGNIYEAVCDCSRDALTNAAKKVSCSPGAEKTARYRSYTDTSTVSVPSR